MDEISQYEAMTLAWAACPSTRPRTIGRCLLGLALLLKDSAAKSTDPLLCQTRERVALQLLILAGESKHIIGREHRRDFLTRVRALIHAMREVGNHASFVGEVEPIFRLRLAS